MRYIKRCNNFPKITEEDVSQHSFYTTILVMFFGDEYNAYAEKNGLEKVNMELALRKAALHDTEESFTSDIPWNMKHITPEVYATYQDAIKVKIDKVYDGSITAQSYHKIGMECKDGLEGAIVGVADMMELSVYLYEEYNKGNKYVEGLLVKCINLFTLNPMYDILIKASDMFSSMVEMISGYRDATLTDLLDVE